MKTSVSVCNEKNIHALNEIVGYLRWGKFDFLNSPMGNSSTGEPT